MNNELLRTRVKGQVEFRYFKDNTLFYACNDGFVFEVPIKDTENSQGTTPTFPAKDKAIYFMRWIRKAME